jgi:hypothetical protein
LRQACDELENEVTRQDQEIIDVFKKEQEDVERENKAHAD